MPDNDRELFFLIPSSSQPETSDPQDGCFKLVKLRCALTAEIGPYAGVVRKSRNCSKSRGTMQPITV